MATGRENLVLAGRVQGLAGATRGARAAELLDRFELADAADRLVKTWSGGMARKLDVAIGLDAPAAGAVPRRADHRARPARPAPRCGPRSAGWPRDEQVTVLLTTHYLEEADRLADRLAIVDHGRVVVEGTPEELKSELRGDARRRRARRRGDAAAARAALLAPCAACARSPWTGARCGPGPTTAPAPCPPVLAALESGGIAGRLRDRRPAVARRRLPAPRRPQPSRRRGHDASTRSRAELARTTAARSPTRLAHRRARSRRCAAARLRGRSRSCSRSSGCCCSARCSVASSRSPGSRGTAPTSSSSRPGVVDHDGAVLQRLGRDGLHRRHGPRRDGPAAGLARAARRADGRHAGLPGAHDRRADRDRARSSPCSPARASPAARAGVLVTLAVAC